MPSPTLEQQRLLDVAFREIEERHGPFLYLNGAIFSWLQEIPTRVFSHTSLIVLDVSNVGQISQIPEAIQSLSRLEVLNLSSNKIPSLPSSLFSLRSLGQLFLARNRISEVSAHISQLVRLKKLDLSDNPIAELPPEIGHLKDLESLDLSRTQITTLPLEIGLLSKLRHLKLDGLTISDLPPELSTSAQSIVNYYRSLLVEQSEKLYEAKLLVVGEGATGKTSLIKRILERGFSNSEDTTKGIAIDRYDVRIDKDSVCRVNVWDFGGQEIYHATHQFFLTKRSLYVLVCSARTDDSKLDYWLHTISLLSDRAPVIIVQNKSDERVSHLDEKTIQRNFQNVVGFLRTSAKTGQGIDILTKEIQERILRLTHIGYLLPKAWIQVRATLESKSSNFIEFEEYLEICEGFKINRQRARLLGQFLHDLGVCLNFSDHPTLKEIVFLKPHWATNAVYRLIDTTSVVENFGRFHLDDLEAIWKDYPRSKFPHLVALMRKFELCFEVPTKLEYVIAELLNPSEPVYEWDSSKNLRLEYHYSFMPAGILTRFIVLADSLLRNSVYWRYGALLKRNGAVGLIVADPFQRKIKVSIRGAEGRDLLELVRERIDHIHRTLNHPEVKEMVNCICDECIVADAPHLFVFQTVKEFYKKGRRSLICDRSAQDVSVELLLGGIEPVLSKNEQKMVDLIKSLMEESDTQSSLLKKVNDVIQLKPNFFGLGLNLNDLIAMLFSGKRSK